MEAIRWTQLFVAKVAVPPTRKGAMAGNFEAYDDDTESLLNQPHVRSRMC
jgi:hypothetical protein